ncbi:phosphopantetheine-binding protein [Kribbella sp. NBC_01505]|uniref:phosphopantetheine-binding protein n=1 Tax=Kribbella sp. NBC_01505 TaxID=2903580 RepID=UPI00386FD19C
MSLAPWSDEFELILRDRLPSLDGRPLTLSTSLVDFGLDSMAAVALLLALEDIFGIEIPDNRLDVEIFASAGSLWALMSELISAAPAEG